MRTDVGPARCARCGAPASGSIAGAPACQRCVEDWGLLNDALVVAAKLRGLGRVAVRLPSGAVYYPKEAKVRKEPQTWRGPVLDGVKPAPPPAPPGPAAPLAFEAGRRMGIAAARVADPDPAAWRAELIRGFEAGWQEWTDAQKLRR